MRGISSRAGFKMGFGWLFLGHYARKKDEDDENEKT